MIIKKVILTIVTICFFSFIFFASAGKEDSNPTGPSDPSTNDYKWVKVQVTIRSNSTSNPIESATVGFGRWSGTVELQRSTGSGGSTTFDLQAYHWGTNGSVTEEMSQTYYVAANASGFNQSNWVAVRATYSNPNPSTTIYLSPQ